MGIKGPLVSVAVVAYQNAIFLHEVVESILGQSYENLEIILADDGSTDNSAEIIKDYASKDRRIVPLLSNYNRGISENLNKAIDCCSGEYICIIAGDDKMYPTKIEKQVSFLENNQAYTICFHNVDVFDQITNTIQFKWLDRYLPSRNAKDALFTANWRFKKRIRKMPSSAWFGRATYLRQGRNDARIKRYHEFIWVLGMLSSNPKAKWHCLPEVLGMYRVHGTSLSNAKLDWLEHAEEINMNYALAAVKFPQFEKEITNEAAYWWFLQLLYNQIPGIMRKYYLKIYFRKFGLVKYLYLLSCKFLLAERLSKVRNALKFRSIFTA